MLEKDKPVLLYTTFPSLPAAEEVGHRLLDDRLAACVNVIPGMVSLYVWQGERQRESEVVMLIKTRAGLAGDVMLLVRKLHPYDNPALLVLPVSDGSRDFLDWIVEQTSASSDRIAAAKE